MVQKPIPNGRPEKFEPKAQKLEALQNEIQNLLKKAPTPETPAIPRPIPEWAQKQNVELRTKNVEQAKERNVEKPPENLPTQSETPIKKIPMQEIRPRPAQAPQSVEKKPGPGEDRYREPID
jgi:hypothetical protein